MVDPKPRLDQLRQMQGWNPAVEMLHNELVRLREQFELLKKAVVTSGGSVPRRVPKARRQGVKRDV